MAFVPAVPLPARGAHASAALSTRRVTRRALPRRSAHRTGVVAAPSMALDKTIAETLAFDCVNKTLLALADAAGVDMSAVSGTLFAPTQAAFNRLPAGTVEWLCARPELARRVIERHVMSQVVTTEQMSGVGYFEGVDFGPVLSYEGLGPLVKVGGLPLVMDSSNRECSNGIIHAIDGVLLPPDMKLPSSFELPAIAPLVGDSTVNATYKTPASTFMQSRACGACAPSTQGGRKAMGLVSQLPFWAYGPPFNAGKQEDYEPISAAAPQASVDYQIFPPGTVVVEPDATSAAELLPVSGMSKYIGQTKRIVEGDALSSYAEKLPASQ